MRPFYLAAALLLFVSVASANAADMPKPASVFAVGATHVNKYVPQSNNGNPALILIPGLTDNASVWDGTVAQFAGTHTIYVLTLAGFGGFPAVTGQLIDTAVANVNALIAQEHLDKPVVIGHSLGGFITIRVAETNSSALRGIVAVDGLPVFPGADTLTSAQRTALATQMSAPMANLTPAGLIAAEKKYSLPYMTQEKNIDTVAAFSEGANPAATTTYMQEMASADIRPELGKISVPFLELGPFDPTLDPFNPQSPMKTLAAKQAYYQKLISGAPKGTVRIVDNSRHFIMIDQPQAFYAQIAAFLTSLP
ncbi:MAG: alpha/beta hydrolase [Candidatus Eremiobacteraeota bacterium]|nr:alpha/beta hydrolase [Candidatus Eremiobacteraeota bacterium]